MASLFCRFNPCSQQGDLLTVCTFYSSALPEGMWTKCFSFQEQNHKKERNRNLLSCLHSRPWTLCCVVLFSILFPLKDLGCLNTDIVSNRTGLERDGDFSRITSASLKCYLSCFIETWPQLVHDTSISFPPKVRLCKAVPLFSFSLLEIFNFKTACEV